MSDLPQEWVNRCKELLGGEIFTRDAPGKWEGKQGSHVPVSEKAEDGSVTVKVPHVMKKGEDEDEDHWIELVFVTNADGEVAACAKFTPTDAEAVITFKPEEGKEYTPYGFCNKHGLWKGDKL